NLSTHIDQFIDEEQSTFKHLLVDQDIPFGLDGRNQDNTQKIRRKTRPRCIRNGQDRPINKGINFIILLSRDKDIITSQFKFDPQSRKYRWYNPQFLETYVLDRDFRPSHSCQTNERTNLDHIWKHFMACSTQFLNAFNRQ